MSDEHMTLHVKTTTPQHVNNSACKSTWPRVHDKFKLHFATQAGDYLQKAFDIKQKGQGILGTLKRASKNDDF